MRNLLLVAAGLLLGTNVLAQMPAPADYLLLKDLVYHQVPGWNGRMDIYMPKTIKRRAPLLINIHGGGWVHGRKEDETGFAPFLSKGFIVANIEYRLAEQAPAPAAVIDIRKALSYLAERKDSLLFDAKKVVVMGGSAGGHLALMAGLLGKDHRFDPPGKVPMLQAAVIIDRYGPTNLLTYDAMYKPGKASSAWLGNKGKDTSFIKSISPINYVHRNQPAILILHGDLDRTVPIEQSKELVAAIRKVKGAYEFYVVKGGRHGNFQEPEKSIIDRKMMAFVEHYLFDR